MITWQQFDFIQIFDSDFPFLLFVRLAYDPQGFVFSVISWEGLHGADAARVVL